MTATGAALALPLPNPILVRHDAATVARLVGVEHPCCDGLLLAMPPVGPPFAAVAEGNPLAPDWLFDVDVPAERILMRSGTLADEPFGDDPRTWMRPGHEAFRAFCDAAAPTLRLRGKRIAFRPHARHVLNDVQGCLNFLRTREGQPFEIVLAPADLLTAEMLRDAEDHLTRILETLGSRASAVLLTDAAPTSEVPDAPLREVPLGEGVLPAAAYRRLIRACVPPTTPIVLLPSRLADQRAWLAV